MGIFVSYSHADTDEVVKIVELLKSSTDIPVWFDHELRGGDHYFSIIANQILENEYFIFIVSDNSVNSDWCIHELEFAMAEKRKIVAVWLDNITLPAQVKFIIQNTHYINWYGAGSEKFIDSISKCFLGSDSALVTKAQERSGADEHSSLRADKKYFITDKEIASIKHLLELEAKNKYSECFKPENTVCLGLAYDLGIKTEPDPKKAELYYKAGMFRGNGDAAYLYAALMADKDPDNTQKYINIMKEAAEGGGVLAMTYYGDACYEGLYGIPKDTSEAVKLWKKAADAGYPTAQYYMSYAYRWGIGVEQDYGIALMYALSSMEHNFPRAYRILGLMYEYGNFVDKDLEEAKRYFEKAINLSDYLSLCYLGGIYHYDDENYEESIKLYKKAEKYADEGKIRSGIPYYRMGQSLYYGDGIEKDLELSVNYYLRAAERNHEKAKKYVVSNIRELESEEKKLSYLLRASELDCKNAEYYVAAHYYNIENIEKSREYYTLGAEKGDIFCVQALLANFYARTFADKDRIDRELSLKYFRLLFSLAGAEDLDTLKSVDQLSLYYYAYAIELDYDLEGGKPDKALALHYYAKSLEVDYQMLNNIVFFAVHGFLFPEKSGSGLPHDVDHSEDILNIVYNEFCSLNEGSRTLAKELSDNVLDDLINGHEHIANCYKIGKDVSKNREMRDMHLSRSAFYAHIKKHNLHSTWIKTEC